MALTLEELKSFYNGKKGLVTGHTGFKGSWLVRILTLAGAQVTGYALNPPTDPNLFEIAGLEDTIHSVVGDVRDLAGDRIPPGSAAYRPRVLQRTGLHLRDQRNGHGQHPGMCPPY